MVRARMESNSTGLVAGRSDKHRKNCKKKMSSLLNDMRALITKYRVRGLLEMRAQGDLIGHSARRDEEGSFFAGYLGHMCFKSESGRLMVHIVTQGSKRSVFVHFFCRD